MKRVLRWLLNSLLGIALTVAMMAVAQEAIEPEQEVLQEDAVEVTQEPDDQQETQEIVVDEQEEQAPAEQPVLQENADQDEPASQEPLADQEDEEVSAQEDGAQMEEIVVDAAEQQAPNVVEDQAADVADQPTDEQQKPEAQEEAIEVDAQETMQEPQMGEDAQPEQTSEEQPELGPDEVMGIDTVDLEDPQGNWLYKRVWWERAESKYEKIRATVNKILEYRTGFFARRADLDKNVLDPFYIKIGLSQAELQEIIDGLIESAQKRADAGDSEFAEKAKEDKQALEKIREDIQTVVKDDEEVEQAILMLVEQINKVRQVEQQAWQDFKSIARVLDDRKARELFYRVDNGWKNIQELSNYIMGSFTQSFDTLIERVKTEVTNVDDAVAALKGRGIDLKNKMLEPQQEPEQEEEEEPEEKGFFARYITDPVSSVGSSAWSLIRWPYDKLFGTSQADEPETADELDDTDSAE